MRKNETLEEEVESMDKKIGLLVQNRISVQVHSFLALSVYFLSLCRMPFSLYPLFVSLRRL